MPKFEEYVIYLWLFDDFMLNFDEFHQKMTKAHNLYDIFENFQQNSAFLLKLTIFGIFVKI